MTRLFKEGAKQQSSGWLNAKDLLDITCGIRELNLRKLDAFVIEELIKCSRHHLKQRSTQTQFATYYSTILFNWSFIAINLGYKETEQQMNAFIFEITSFFLLFKADISVTQLCQITRSLGHLSYMLP